MLFPCSPPIPLFIGLFFSPLYFFLYALALGKGGYVLALKENHPEVYAEVKELFPEKALGEAEYTEITKDHGRIVV